MEATRVTSLQIMENKTNDTLVLESCRFESDWQTLKMQAISVDKSVKSIYDCIY